LEVSADGTTIQDREDKVLNTSVKKPCLDCHSCSIKHASGCRVMPPNDTRRLFNSMKNKTQYVTGPRHVSTSTLKKSAPASTSMGDRMNSFQVVVRFRSGAGAILCRHPASDQTVGNLLRRHGIAPVPERSKTTTWKDFIRRHRDVLAGTDFFTVEVLAWRGLVTNYVLFFLHLESRRVSSAGSTDRRETCWMRPAACNATLEGRGNWNGCRYLLHDRDAKFGAAICQPLAAGGVQDLRLASRSPNWNGFPPKGLIGADQHSRRIVNSRYQEL
jgi:hypothetical protein